MNKGVGQYDLEYSQCECFWGTEPGKYVRRLLTYRKDGAVLDLGAGEGKNAIFLAEKGFVVTAVECSRPAIKNYCARKDTLPQRAQQRINMILGDVRSYEIGNSYDVVIAYGLLHCLPSICEIEMVVRKIQDATIPGGLNVIVTFTDVLPVPAAQPYLVPTLLPSDYLQEAYNGWAILDYENDILSESHPTSRIIHEHSLCRMIAKKHV